MQYFFFVLMLFALGCSDEKEIECTLAGLCGQEFPVGKYIDVTAGHYHGCGIDERGAVGCWGTGMVFGYTEAWHHVYAESGYSKVIAGESYSCAIGNAGVSCWGIGQDKQPPTQSSSGEAIDFTEIIPGLTYIWGIEEGEQHVFWGEGIEPSIFQMMAPGSIAAQSTGPFVHAKAGWYQNCGLSESGLLECWGCTCPEELELLCGSLHYQTDYGQCEVPQETFVNMDASLYHTCGINTEGKALCWGCESSTGNGQCQSSEGPYVQIATGMHHNCAILEDGYVECWGRSDLGQTSPPAVKFDSISCGALHCCGLGQDGEAYCWGDDWERQSSPM